MFDQLAAIADAVFLGYNRDACDRHLIMEYTWEIMEFDSIPLLHALQSVISIRSHKIGKHLFALIQWIFPLFKLLVEICSIGSDFKPSSYSGLACFFAMPLFVDTLVGFCGRDPSMNASKLFLSSLKYLLEEQADELQNPAAPTQLWTKINLAINFVFDWDNCNNQETKMTLLDFAYMYYKCWTRLLDTQPRPLSFRISHCNENAVRTTTTQAPMTTRI